MRAVAFDIVLKWKEARDMAGEFRIAKIKRKKKEKEESGSEPRDELTLIIYTAENEMNL